MVYQALRYDDEDGCYYWQKGTRVSLSKNFITTEFECKCSHKECTLQKIKASHIAKLQEIRNEIGPIKTSSSFRCKQHQRDLSNAGYETAIGTSQHELGCASDLYAEDMDALYAACEKRFMAIGRAKSFIHVDERRDKIRRWGYKSM